MNNHEKLALMDKMIREMTDIKHSQVALVEKLSKLQVDNMQLNNKEVEESIDGIFSKVSENIDLLEKVEEHFETARDKFETDHNLNVPPEEGQA